MDIKYSKIRLKVACLAQWDREGKGRYYYGIQRAAGHCRRSHNSKREDDIISKVRFGHTGLNNTVKKMNKHETGKCETLERVMLECGQYSELQKNKIQSSVK